MAWKKDDNGNFVLDGENPIWVSDSGEEKSVDYPAMSKSLREANAESKSRKEELRGLNEKYALFNGIEDLVAWKAEADKAFETVKNLSEKDKEIEAQIAEKIATATGNLKAQMAEKNKKLAEKDKALADQTARLNMLLVKANVQSSKILNERLKPDDKPFIVQMLERAGRIDAEGKVIFVYDDGSTIMAGDDAHNASADEAIPLLMEKMGVDPKVKILSPNTTSGSGGNPNTGGGVNMEVNPWKKETWNLTKQSEISVKNPALAKQLKAAAGL